MRYQLKLEETVKSKNNNSDSVLCEVWAKTEEMADDLNNWALSTLKFMDKLQGKLKGAKSNRANAPELLCPVNIFHLLILTRPSYKFFTPPKHATCLANLILLHLHQPTNVSSRVCVSSISLRSLLYPPVMPSFFSPNILLSNNTQNTKSKTIKFIYQGALQQEGCVIIKINNRIRNNTSSTTEIRHTATA